MWTHYKLSSTTEPQYLTCRHLPPSFGLRHNITVLIYSRDMANTSKVDLVGVGLNATDTVIPLPHFPAVGSKVEFGAAKILPGGQVASTVVACQHWGLSTRYVGKIGDDQLRDWAERNALDIAQAQRALAPLLS